MKRTPKTVRNRIFEKLFPKDCFTVHWGGKILPNLITHIHVDCLPIFATFLQGDKQLLSVTKHLSGTSENQAHAVFDALKIELLKESLAMCFDTTRAKQLLGRDLIYLACQHHVLELIAGAVFNKIIPLPCALDILLFKRFKDFWDFRSKQFQERTHYVAADNIKKYQMIEFITLKLVTKRQPKDDY